MIEKKTILAFVIGSALTLVALFSLTRNSQSLNLNLVDATAEPVTLARDFDRTRSRMNRAYNIALLPVVALHREQQAQWINQTAPGRFVVYFPIGGFGNRIFGLLSMILYAKITHRAFYLSTEWTDLLYFYDLGLGNCSEESANIPLEAELLNRWDSCFWKGSGDSVKWATTDVNITYPDWNKVRTNCPLFSWLAQNPVYIPWLMDVGMITARTRLVASVYNDHQALHFEILANLVQQYLRPQQKVLVDLQQILQEHTASTTCLIGVQLRLGGSKVAWADPERMSTKELPRIWETMHRMANGSLPTFCESLDSVKFFLATDSIDAQKEAQQEFGSSLFALDTKIVHLDRGNAGREGLRRTILDVELLALCDDLLLSYSTFGAVAASRRKIQPYRVINDEAVRDPLMVDLSPLTEEEKRNYI